MRTGAFPGSGGTVLNSRFWCVLAVAALTSPARAQLRLPLPTLPLRPLQQSLGQIDAQPIERLTDLRHLQIRRLLRANRRVLEADPHGEPIVRGEIRASSPNAAALERARAQGYAVEREQTIVAALAWMVQQQLPVINVSLVGPDNRLLGQTVEALVARGFIIVAAVGNDGSAAAPLYPAAYPGVTGVDAHLRVLLEAERGPQVTFAARGADLKAADLRHGWVTVRGAAFTAPIVAALLAAPMETPGPQGANAAVAALIAQAVDLGPPGKDLTYGYGLVGVE